MSSFPIKCRAAVMYDFQKPLVIEEVIIAVPKEDQVRVKLISSGICLSDVTLWEGKISLLPGQHFPLVLGHEGVGIVESVGPNVISVNPGDRVLTTYVNRCKDCSYCSSALTNFCLKENLIVLGMTPHKKLATSQSGHKDVHSFVALGTFSEYVLLKSNQVDKIADNASSFDKLENLSAITCATGSGFGASKYIAKVAPGTSVSVWGAGAFGLSAMLGAKLACAKNIVAIDVHNDRKQLAVAFGATEFINPKELDKPVAQYLLEKYGGVDYAFDCNGEPSNVPDGFKSLTPFGTFTFVAATHSGTEVSQPTGEIAFGKNILGGFFGNRPSDEMYEEILGLYKEGVYDLDSMITHKFRLEQINEAIESVTSGQSVKTLIVFD